MEWQEKYPKKTKPSYDELLDYFQPHIRDLFTTFEREMRSQFDVSNKYHKFMQTAGWSYGFGRSYSCELLTVTIQDDCFDVLGVSVKDDESLRKALNAAKKAYDDGFEGRYAAVCALRRESQIARTKVRIEREQQQMDKLLEHVDPAKFNQFKWHKKVSRRDLNALYQGEAKGMLDEALLDDVGLGFYLRCKQAKEVRECMDKGQIICLHCGAILTAGRVSPTGAKIAKKDGGDALVHCECGYSYTYREYRRSCNAVNMPGGRAMPIFEQYMEKWPGCKTASDKMLLIDWLIHECHVTLMSGIAGRSVCINLIEGTLTQIGDLINKLAYEHNL